MNNPRAYQIHMPLDSMFSKGIILSNFLSQKIQLPSATVTKSHLIHENRWKENKIASMHRVPTEQSSIYNARKEKNKFLPPKKKK